MGLFFSGVTLAPLRRVMNAAVRFVAGLGPRDHVTAAWRELHWLPIDQRIIYKLCIDACSQERRCSDLHT